LKKCILAILIFMSGTSAWAVTFVTADLMGQLGNQFFIIAAATSLALDHGAVAVFPDLKTVQQFNIPLNYQQVFPKIGVFLKHPIENYYLEKNFHYDPIPFAPNLRIRGWFQSEKYFSHHKNEILKLFAPTPQISTYLNEKYGYLIKHPHTVSIHYRAYRKENSFNANIYADCNLQYYEKAISLFPQDALFVVFSDDIPYCKEMFKGLPFQFHYVEGETHYHDLYLMSFCKNNIICNSTFSWWGAYLNLNPSKIVVAPFQWFHPTYKTDTQDLIPEEWLILK
jgi:Glycosyl transferase family 11